VPLIVADASDVESVNKMVASTSVILTTVGPYQLYCNELVEACAAQGTDYVDLCGEPAWMHKMIAAHSAAAEKSGARIVFSCGFDSIPFDLGVFFLQQHAVSNFGSTVGLQRASAGNERNYVWWNLGQFQRDHGRGGKRPKPYRNTT